MDANGKLESENAGVAKPTVLLSLENKLEMLGFARSYVVLSPDGDEVFQTVLAWLAEFHQPFLRIKLGLPNATPSELVASKGVKELLVELFKAMNNNAKQAQLMSVSKFRATVHDAKESLTNHGFECEKFAW